MDSPSFKPHSPSKTPLYPASPERINQQKLVSSPSMPSDIYQKASDVQSRIAFINNLSRAGSPAPNSQQTSSTSVSAALQRAILGREEAESALARVNAQISEAQSRERKISERLESLLEELQNTRERQAHERALYEKEVRKARKEAFRAGSTLVKLQEELKLSKSENKTLKDEIRIEREATEKAKQEAFERAYALAGMTEEFQGLKDQLRALEAANQTGSLEMEVVGFEDSSNRPAIDYADQGTCTTPTSRRPKRSADASEILQSSESQSIHEEETPTKKIRLSRRVSNKENEDPEELEHQSDLIDGLKAEIKIEKRQRERAEDMVHFLKMECQFKRCSCRIAESQGFDYVYDKDWENICNNSHHRIVEEQQSHFRDETPAVSAHSPFESPVTAMTPPTPEYREPTVIEKEIQPTDDQDITFCPTTGTFVSVPSPPPLHVEMPDRPREEPLVLPNADEADVMPSCPDFFSVSTKTAETLQTATDGQPFEAYAEVTEASNIQTMMPFTVDFTEHTNTENDYIQEQQQHSEPLPITPTEQVTVAREESVTRTVPLQTEPRRSGNPSSIIPGTPVTREEALAQIRARRGRAKSTTKRSASASEATMGKALNNRIPGVSHSDTRSEPDVSDRRRNYASAPVRRY
ncbi:hypothetical protein BGW36DRAFT_295040 [Talaromyces proteolyticus]|uniref:Uncharacterized protein n=1 Tax=Talaromyces proteolyticus TaxID=1131652 RepID=A0AAD4KX77_9EURO|nr:uncharacterized protein BGW36DRAFT_295040 [Talaromyces proteolyticus]KAH8698883.1 hypothetical protein BGW36DRAFT_295040 [Talaromyces proteolyticus]